MKFYSGIEAAEIVWDAANNRVLCTFADGVYETDDERTIGLLKKLGYKHDEPPSPRKRDELIVTAKPKPKKKG